MRHAGRQGEPAVIGRVARLLLVVLTWASVLLCVALVVLWVRSYRTRTVVEFWRADGLWEVVSDRGRLGLDNEAQRRLEADSARRLSFGLSRRRLLSLRDYYDRVFESLSTPDVEPPPGLPSDLTERQQLARELEAALKNQLVEVE